MVDRDDLEDGGAAHVAEVFSEIRKDKSSVSLGVPGGDFQAKDSSLREILSARPEVFAHNLETIERLTPRVRDTLDLPQKFGCFKTCERVS